MYFSMARLEGEGRSMEQEHQRTRDNHPGNHTEQVSTPQRALSQYQGWFSQLDK